MQAYFHGEIGRKIAARRKLEYSVEKNCRWPPCPTAARALHSVSVELMIARGIDRLTVAPSPFVHRVGVEQRKLELLETAVAEAEAIKYTHFAGLVEARNLMERLQDENEVKEMLDYALAARDGDEMTAALKAADALGLEEIWYLLAEGDSRKNIIPRCRLMTEQLSRYGELMQGLAAAMRERTVEALQAMIVECESVELDCGEVQEAREMLKMAEFETNSRKCCLASAVVVRLVLVYSASSRLSSLSVRCVHSLRLMPTNSLRVPLRVS